MNAIFMTQANGLGMFYDLMVALRPQLRLDKVGFYVTDSFHYATFLETHPTFEKEFIVVKEWEVLSQAKTAAAADPAAISTWEKKLGVPSLWPALVADRRLTSGKRSMLFQDYSSRFDHPTLQKILLESLRRMDAFFDAVKPDAVFSFICVTAGEYLSYLMAKDRGVRFLNLRPTRVRNYMTWGESIFEPAADIKDAYEGAASAVDERWRKEAEAYVAQVQQQHALYEGVIMPSRQPRKTPKQTANPLSHLAHIVARQIKFWRLGHKDDNHNPGMLTAGFYKRVVHPWTAARVNRVLSSEYVTKDALTKHRYAFFPLHTEPEVSLLVYSPTNLNQIEGVRNVSQSLPAGMKLIVKDHPASIGKRPLSYYEKLLAIPNVLLADPALTARQLIEHAELVVIITGSVALEALLLKKPVVTLGRSPFDFLPRSMIRHAASPERLADDIHDLLSGYAYQPEAMVRFVGAVMQSSVAIDFYSVLLKKRGVFQVNAKSGDPYLEEIKRLADHTASRFKTPAASAFPATRAAVSAAVAGGEHA